MAIDKRSVQLGRPTIVRVRSERLPQADDVSGIRTMFELLLLYRHVQTDPAYGFA
jgi:hypothetical protein